MPKTKKGQTLKERYYELFVENELKAREGKMAGVKSDAQIIATLEKEFPAVRVRAVRALGTFPGDGPVKALREALENDSSAEVRREADGASGLTRIRVSKSRPAEKPRYSW